jgi:hypothetical protein
LLAVPPAVEDHQDDGCGSGARHLCPSGEPW